MLTNPWAPYTKDSSTDRRRLPCPPTFRWLMCSPPPWAASSDAASFFCRIRSASMVDKLRFERERYTKAAGNEPVRNLVHRRDQRLGNDVMEQARIAT